MNDTSLEALVERMETAYKRISSLSETWRGIGITEGRSQAFHLVASMAENTSKTFQNLTRLETLYEVMCRLREGNGQRGAVEKEEVPPVSTCLETPRS